MVKPLRSATKGVIVSIMEILLSKNKVNAKVNAWDLSNSMTSDWSCCVSDCFYCPFLVSRLLGGHTVAVCV